MSDEFPVGQLDLSRENFDRYHCMGLIRARHLCAYDGNDELYPEVISDFAQATNEQLGFMKQANELRDFEDAECKLMTSLMVTGLRLGTQRMFRPDLAANRRFLVDEFAPLRNSMITTIECRLLRITNQNVLLDKLLSDMSKANPRAAATVISFANALNVELGDDDLTDLGMVPTTAFPSMEIH